MSNKKIVFINTVSNNSTGRIMHDIQKEAIMNGFDTLAIVGRRRPYIDLPCEKLGNDLSFWIHVIITTLFDRHGSGSAYFTNKIVDALRREQPDIIHLHNIHGYYLNLSILFRYITKEYMGQVVWTLHDCWTYTGHCAYYSATGCYKWMTGCSHCPNKNKYPISLFWDNSKSNYDVKKRLFTSLQACTLVTPSDWLKREVGKSFLNAYETRTINNGIDTNLFDFSIASERKNVFDKYGINQSAKLLLSVASIWEPRKGLNDLVELSAILGEKYQMVIVGLNKWQIASLPTNIIGLNRTDCINDLVDLYSSADVFINPSREETFSLVTVEAQACGAPVIAVKGTAVEELIADNNGITIDDLSPEGYMKAITELLDRHISREEIRNTVINKNTKKMCNEYIDLFRELLIHESAVD